MRFVNYNDYELLYLIKDGVEPAFNVLFKKYDILIWKIISEQYPYGDKRNDLVQEARMKLYECIYRFDESYGVSFYSYFKFILNRSIIKLKNEPYYNSSLLLLNEVSQFQKHDSSSDLYLLLRNGKRFFDDEIDLKIYQECLLEGLSVKAFSEKYSYSYRAIYYRKNCIISMLKKMLTNK